MWLVYPAILCKHLKMTPLCSGISQDLLLVSVVVHSMLLWSAVGQKQSGVQQTEKETETSVIIRDIGISRCQARCIETGGCLRFVYNYKTLTCRLPLGESNRVEVIEGFIVLQKSHLDVPPGPCAGMSCSLGSRCLEGRSGKAVCVKAATSTTTPPTPTTALLFPTTANHSKVLQTFVGCYNTIWATFLSHGSKITRTDLTTEICKFHCLRKNFTYFGTQNGKICLCDNAVSRTYTKIFDSKCDVPCSGDRSTMCGGAMRISIYKIC